MASIPRINIGRIRQTAELIRNMEIDKPLNFYSIVNGSGHEIVFHDMYPPLHAEGVVDFFFFVMIHNYGFWLDDGEKYVAPLVGKWSGKDTKGSDLLWKMLCAAWQKDCDTFSPMRLARISDAEFAKIFSDDNGPMEFFCTKERKTLTRDYARWLLTRRLYGQTPGELLDYVNECNAPADVLRNILTHPENGLPGYREDPLGKKAELLIMALMNRPDQLLKRKDSSNGRPIVDYHDERITLRLGHVTLPREWVEENVDRRLTTREREEAIRKATERADTEFIKVSGRSRDEVDVLKFMGRRYCPEMTVPNCSACLLQSACAKRVELFQPVFRTTFY